jgi:hypothetical protein
LLLKVQTGQCRQLIQRVLIERDSAVRQEVANGYKKEAPESRPPEACGCSCYDLLPSKRGTKEGGSTFVRFASKADIQAAFRYYCWWAVLNFMEHHP